MKKQITLISITLLFSIISQSPSWAGKVLERIKETGVITAGARKDAIPFGYINDKGQWVGYSLDMLELIRQQTEKQLGKPIKLQLVEVTPQNRFEKLKNGSIDLECGSTTFTWNREKEIDFSVSYFASGTQILTKKGSGLNEVESLAGKRIGVISETTNERVIKSQQSAAQLVTVKDRLDGLKKLEAGEIDGFASDGIVLEGLKKTTANANNLEIVPNYPYQYESYACTLPHDESQWRDLVNYSLIKFMEGIVTDEPNTVRIFDKWFGEDGEVPYSRETINSYFQGIVNTYEWIPILEY
ncbi:amino acid ABC transporter substrate-binding protein [Aphanothece hegewaldii CCALA 016]|uniref:Amino acid ABC transporter substrate-binding protein n=1 Tax=Aphanothece hegewaldii CCALA 016 TaxID=2107694 RepID=A0A2T1M2C7_9CHRO|nr:amino acid ABC transporter substrate-binding protein [Aphanothece hegewaldii]PSF38904.1 amino acid ABC transporter substrate-binding protein [Aphanothece hegewaldii CCALA 016]